MSLRIHLAKEVVFLESVTGKFKNKGADMIYGVDMVCPVKKQKYLEKIDRRVRRWFLNQYVYRLIFETSTTIGPPVFDEERFSEYVECQRDLMRNADSVAWRILWRKFAMDFYGGKKSASEIFCKYRTDVSSIKPFIKEAVVNGRVSALPREHIEDTDYDVRMVGAEIPICSEITEQEIKLLTKSGLHCGEKIKLKMNIIEQLKLDIQEAEEATQKLKERLGREINSGAMKRAAWGEFDLLKRKYNTVSDQDFLAYIANFGEVLSVGLKDASSVAAVVPVSKSTELVSNTAVDSSPRKTRTRTVITNDTIDRVLFLLGGKKTPEEIKKETGLSFSSISKIKTGERVKA